jgi:hypothetical protein
MSQQDLHDADVDALSQEQGRKTVAKRVGREILIETARCPCCVEGQSGRRTGQMRGAPTVGEESLWVAMDLPDLA